MAIKVRQSSFCQSFSVSVVQWNALICYSHCFAVNDCSITVSALLCSIERANHTHYHQQLALCGCHVGLSYFTPWTPFPCLPTCLSEIFIREITNWSPHTHYINFEFGQNMPQFLGSRWMHLPNQAFRAYINADQWSCFKYLLQESRWTVTKIKGKMQLNYTLTKQCH